MAHDKIKNIFLKIFVCFSVAAVAVYALVFLYYHDPNLPNSPTPDCLFRKITSLQCPGCGTTRAVYAFLHLNIKEGFSQNIYAAVLMPIVLLSLVFRKIADSRWYPVFLFIFIIGTTIAKNI